MEIIGRDSIDYNIGDNSLYDIINYNEKQVVDIMRDVLGRDESVCRCSMCVEDIYAISLNSLPPRYIQSTSLRRYETSSAYISDDEVKEKVTEAVAKVKLRPKH